ncbi:hypothetical protein [Desulfuromonas sp. CSMB_57]|uniref:hypothetical protein n=1 Tax=Desulfuromonas sp. CSMB_57 TaxID=2807629 RepID=UPI001CD4D639|nr:hypothetical protein [Desulfuromonas sp. CSMB_57]
MWTPLDINEPTIIEYDGDLPSHIYRYRQLSNDCIDRIIDFEIIEEAIYLAGLKDLNDPDEGRFLVKFKGTDNELFNFWCRIISHTYPSKPLKAVEAQAKANIEETRNLGNQVPERVAAYTKYVLGHVLRVACFTTNPFNYSMWANYGKYNGCGGPVGHGGICIEYLCDNGWRGLNLHPVQYSDEIPEIDAVNMDESKLVKAIYMKAKEWQSEEEWRIFSLLDVMPPFPPNLTTNSKYRLEGSVKSVIFGMATPKVMISKIMDRVKAKKSNILFKQVAQNPVTFDRYLLDIS